MKRVVLLCAVVLFVAIPLRAQTKPLPIFLLSQWNINQAVEFCELSERNGAPPCALYGDPKQLVVDFQNQLQIAFASESACHGLTLRTDRRSADPHWNLYLDIDPRKHKPSWSKWTLQDSEDHLYIGRITTPERAVQQICKIVRGVGGETK